MGRHRALYLGREVSSFTVLVGGWVATKRRSLRGCANRGTRYRSLGHPVTRASGGVLMPRTWFRWTFRRHPLAFLVFAPLWFIIAFGMMTLMVAAYDYHILN